MRGQAQQERTRGGMTVFHKRNYMLLTHTQGEYPPRWPGAQGVRPSGRRPAEGGGFGVVTAGFRRPDRDKEPPVDAVRPGRCPEGSAAGPDRRSRIT